MKGNLSTNMQYQAIQLKLISMKLANTKLSSTKLPWIDNNDCFGLFSTVFMSRFIQIWFEEIWNLVCFWFKVVKHILRQVFGNLFFSSSRLELRNMTCMTPQGCSSVIWIVENLMCFFPIVTCNQNRLLVNSLIAFWSHTQSSKTLQWMCNRAHAGSVCIPDV